MQQNQLVLLTGATGLLGSHILIELLKNGYSARLLVRDVEKAKLQLKEIAGWYSLNISNYEEKISYFQGDVLDLGKLEDAFQEVQYVIHAAAIVSSKRAEKDFMLKTNAEGTANMVNIANDLNVNKFVHISSVSTLGPNPDGAVDEDYFFKPGPNTSAYAITKYAAEQEVWRSIEEGLNAVILNPSFVIGPSRKETSSSAIFHAVKKGLPGYINGRTGYVDAKDVAKVCVMMLSNELSAERFILNAENRNTLDFINTIARNLNVKPPKREVKASWTPVIVFFSFIRSLFNKKATQISKDQIRMASSRKDFDGNRILHKVKGFEYTPINQSIEETAKIMNSFL
jgi:nucleoside-diphosphate-sugar epimerase